MSIIDLKLKTYNYGKIKSFDELTFEITRLNTDKYLLEQKLQQKENIIKEAIKYNEQLLKIYDCGVEKDNAETNILILKGALEILDKGE